jgi:hypothetical protein
MNTIAFLELLAKNVYYSETTATLIKTQPDKIKEAILTNNNELLKHQLNNRTLLADMCLVFQT